MGYTAIFLVYPWMSSPVWYVHLQSHIHKESFLTNIYYYSLLVVLQIYICKPQMAVNHPHTYILHFIFLLYSYMVFNYLVVLLLLIVLCIFYGWTYKRIFHGVLRYTFYTQTDVNKRKLLKPRKHEVMRTPIYLFSFSLLLINRSYFSCDRTYFSLPP